MHYADGTAGGGGGVPAAPRHSIVVEPLRLRETVFVGTRFDLFDLICTESSATGRFATQM